MYLAEESKEAKQGGKSMSKMFAIFIPIFSIIITTLFIVFSKNNSNEKANIEANKIVYLFLLLAGILLLLGLFFILK